MMAEDKSTTSSTQQVAVPSWLDVKVIEDALRNNGEENAKVKELCVRAATAPGDNFCSALYRVKATLDDGAERSVIVKCLPLEKTKAAGITDSGFFPREIAAFSRVILEMEALLEKAAPGRFAPMGPRCLLHSNAPNMLIVMEDLSTQGFKMADRRSGLDFRHAVLALRTLAHFHASSYALLQKDPGLAKEFDNPWRAMAPHGFKNFLEMGLESAADFFRGSPGFEEYARCLETFKPVAVDTFIKLQEAKPAAFNVLIHGDFWMNNVMFRHEGGHLQDIRFVDFQVAHVASPALDLLYFLGSSLSEDVSTHQQDLLLQEYHSALTETMQLLGFQAPSLATLEADMAANGPTVLFGVTCVLPSMKTQQGTDFEATVSDDASGKSDVYENPVVKRWFQRVFPEYKRRGWLPLM